MWKPSQYSLNSSMPTGGQRASTQPWARLSVMLPISSTWPLAAPGGGADPAAAWPPTSRWRTAWPPTVLSSTSGATGEPASNISLPAVVDALLVALDGAPTAGDRPRPLPNLAREHGRAATIGLTFEEFQRGHRSGGRRRAPRRPPRHPAPVGVGELFVTTEEADDVVAVLDRTVGLERLQCLHVNVRSGPRREPRSAPEPGERDDRRGGAGPAAWASSSPGPAGHPRGAR